MKPEDKVNKIYETFNERNGKLVEYITDILLKNYLTALTTLSSIVVNIKDVTPDVISQSVKELIGSADEYIAFASKNPDTMANLKKCIEMVKQLEHMKESLFK